MNGHGSMHHESYAGRLHQLAKHASDYEPGALLKALFECEFSWDTVRFEGVRELNPGRGEAVRSLRIERGPPRCAIIRLNAGLLSNGSPLPDYFRDFARRLADPDAFISFLGFWDSVQLGAAAYACLPSLGTGRGRVLSQSYRARLRLVSPMFLHWLFRGAFPELRVEVTAAVFAQSNQGTRARVGGPLDGRSVIGAEFMGRRAGFCIRLYADSPACEGVPDWEAEASRRIRQIGASLTRLGKPLEVRLHFDNYLHGQELAPPHSERRQLGVRPWLRANLREQLGPGEVLLVAPGTDLLPPAERASAG